MPVVSSSESACRLQVVKQVELTVLYTLLCALLVPTPTPTHTGYRYVHILSPGGEKLEQCTIFVHVKIENAADVVYEVRTYVLGDWGREGGRGVGQKHSCTVERHSALRTCAVDLTKLSVLYNYHSQAMA